MRVFLQELSKNPYTTLLRNNLASADVEVSTLPLVVTEDWLKSQRRPDSVVHYHWPSYFYTISDRLQMTHLVELWERNLLLARELGFAVIWTAHNLVPHDAVHPDLQRRARIALMKHCDAVLAIARVCSIEPSSSLARRPRRWRSLMRAT